MSEDYDLMGASEWKMDSGRPCTDHVPLVLGCFDEAVLEIGLRWKAQLLQKGQAVKVTALTVLSDGPDRIWDRLYAVGYDEVVFLENEHVKRAVLDFCPWLTAGIIAAYVAREPPWDLILCGAQAPPGNSGLVPTCLSAILKSPCLWDIDDPDAALLSGGPIVVVAGNHADAYLRVPTLRDKLNAKSKMPKMVPILDADIDRYVGGPMPEMTCTHKKRSCRIIDSDDMQAMAVLLLEQIQNFC